MPGADDHMVFTDDAFKDVDGKTVPLTLEPGGPVIGEATLHHIPGKGLSVEARVTDPKVMEFLQGESPSVIFRRER
jgi:hypothetical protein